MKQRGQKVRHRETVFLAGTKQRHRAIDFDLVTRFLIAHNLVHQLKELDPAEDLPATRRRLIDDPDLEFHRAKQNGLS